MLNFQHTTSINISVRKTSRERPSQRPAQSSKRAECFEYAKENYSRSTVRFFDRY